MTPEVTSHMGKGSRRPAGEFEVPRGPRKIRDHQVVALCNGLCGWHLDRCTAGRPLSAGGPPDTMARATTQKGNGARELPGERGITDVSGVSSH